MRCAATVVLGLATATGLGAQAIGPAGQPTPNLTTNIERPIRYRPDGHDFVIENGREFFNRPLYGRNTAFRVDTGDLPEYLLYLPGRGGNLRFGLAAVGGARWLHEAATIEARYRPGEMHHAVRDPLLGPDGELRIAAVPMHETDGLILRIEAVRIQEEVTLLVAFGGIDGRRGRRDGDIGTEPVPISEYFQLTPELCRGDRVEPRAGGFIVHGHAATVLGLLPSSARGGVASAAAWGEPAALLAASTAEPEDPVFVGRIPLAPTGSGPVFLAVQRVAADGLGATAEELGTYRDVSTPRAGSPGARRAPDIPLRAAYGHDELPAAFEAAVAHYARIRGQVSVATPDPYLDAAVAALNIAADAVWDEPQQAVMHGAIAWRSRLLGWRGPYAMDALGWHERFRANFRYWAGRQNSDPIPEKLPPPDVDTNLARSKAALHSNGDMTQSHYDMNLVAIDALFRHLRWTGDLEFAREMWPVIERHLAWQRRLFRREFTTAGGRVLPLYEAYAAIWASDDLQYHGGGTAHASAYNILHRREAARLARLLGHDPSPHEREAEEIARGMRELLWVPERGAFAEFKDWLGLQLVHREAALWSVYHVIDSEVATADEAVSMTHYVERFLPRLPVRGPGVPGEMEHAMYATTSWMPYTWSINNVVFGENVHTALAFWQAGRAEAAWRLTRSALLASMYMGICPGNVGSMNHLDVYRREAQRDFADGGGVFSRALVEGLFGIRPDALGGTLRVAPGFPATWDHASLQRPGLEVRFERHGAREVLRVEALPERFPQVQLELAAHGRRLVSRRELAEGETRAVEYIWAGEPRAVEPVAPALPPQAPPPVPLVVTDVVGVLEPIDLTARFNERLTDIFRPGKYRSPRSPFVSLAIPAQGIGAWAGHVHATAEIDDRGLRAAATQGGALTLPSGVRFVTPGAGDAPNVLFVSQWDNHPDEATVSLGGRARRIHLLMAGSTNHMQSRLDNGEVTVAYADGTQARLALRNPETWWPIDQDYFIDDYQFRLDGPLPVRVDLATGRVRVLERETFAGAGRVIPGGAATVLALDLDASRELRSLTVRALANEVIIGLLAATLER